jgi:hypothetical protein
VAHVDCIQTFTVNGEIAQDVVFESNTCFDFHQMCMVESKPHLGSVKDWTFRGNIVSADSPAISGGWGPDVIQTPNVTIANNTICGVRWAAIGLRGAESTNGQIRNNILGRAERAVDDGGQHFTPARPIMENNLTFATLPLPGDRNLQTKDPLFVDEAHRNFRLRKGSPAIGAAPGGAAVGALEYPNVYYVDPRHPAASDDPAWGYPGVPLATLAKACDLAEAGETVVLRGGVYRETLQPKHDGVTFRAMLGEIVTISGADLIVDWRRETNGSWSAPVSVAPKKLLRDGQTWAAFSYDQGAQRLTVKEIDPRLHVFESVVRNQAFDLNGRKDVKVIGLSGVNTLSK